MALFVRENTVHTSENGLTVRHIVLRGTNFDIGHHIGKIARNRYSQTRKMIRDDTMLIRCQNAYMKMNYPEHYERMKGIAHAYGVHLVEGTLDCSEIFYSIPSVGCSSVFFPNHTTANGAAILSRNFDFPVSDANEPYIFEIYPDQGYSSLYLCSFDLVGGVLDGINSEGLTVAILADDESSLTFPAEPTGGKHVGLHELQIMRYLLDRCSNVAEAKQALLSLKHHYLSTPLHYIIGDRHGNSFVWENSYTTNRFSIIDGGNKPQAVTNFLLHRYASGAPLPDDPNPSGMYQRFATLQAELNSSSLFNIEDMKRILGCVFITQPETHHSRTLWHNLYNASDLSMEISFYDIEDRQNGSLNHTDYFRFQLL